MPALLNNTITSAGKKFINRKGIIYVPNNSNGHSYSKNLKEILEKEGIRCFEINTDNKDYKKALEILRSVKKNKLELFLSKWCNR